MSEGSCGEIPIVIWADVETAPLGQKSKLLEDLGGRPVLRRTLERVCRSEQSGRKVVFCRPEQVDAIKPLTAELPVEVMPVDFMLPGWWPGLQAARKWALEGWRGGLLGTCSFDEDVLAHVLSELIRRLAVSAVMTVPAHAAWVDPKVLDRQIEQYRAKPNDLDITFTQAPPGLAGLVIGKDMLADLLQGSKFPGAKICYIPTKPFYDPISMPCNLAIDPAVVQTGIRFTCDTRRGLAIGRKLAEKLDTQNSDIGEVSGWAKTEGLAVLTQWPREIELELVSGWDWPGGYRPQPQTARGPIDADLLIERVGELARECDDLVVTLGGFGEPTRHPQFEAIVRGLKSAGVWGICLQTGCLFEPATADRIAALPLDLVSLLIDVPERELYAKVMGVDGYEKVQANIEGLLKAIQTQQRATPLPVPEMIKTHETMELMNDFFDGWTCRVGCAVINGYSDYAGQIADRAVNSMAGPLRRMCRQIFRRMTVLADGRVVSCDQDFNGRNEIGSIREESLQATWNGPKMTALRQTQLAGDFSPNALCEKCRQWHRP